MCGIWGIISSRPRKFDYSTFCTLGIANDSRGGDSCGYFIDGHYEYGASKDNKLFQWFFQNNEFLSSILESTVAFGHCRKASIGKINEKTAQPVVITNKDGKVEYVLMHNGTIYNYQELAKKYIPEVDIKDMTDSQVMARIFYHSGYDVLNEYQGTAVFAIADYRQEKPKVFLFKGASKKTKQSKEETEERPLYFCIYNEELLFSSIYSYLLALRPETATWDLNTNYLFEFTGKDLVPVKEYPRKDIYQKDIQIYDFGYVTDGYFNSNYFYDDYIALNQFNNTYSNGKDPLFGKYIITQFGKIVDRINKNLECREIYFWNGVAIRNSACFNFLYNLRKKSGLTTTAFDIKYLVLIRYLSIDRVFSKGNQWFEAISPTEQKLFTGTLNMLTSSSSIEFVNGFRTTTKYGRSYFRAFESLDNMPNETIKKILGNASF